MRIVAGLGLVSCLVLMFSLPRRSWLVGAAVVAAGALIHVARGAAARKKTLPD
jgi:hypothetical protein